MCENILASGICKGVSDHAGIYAYIQAGTEEEDTISARNYKNYEKENLCKDFEANLENSQFQGFINCIKIYCIKILSESSTSFEM